MPRKYLDFDVLIEATGGRYRAKILDSPAGQAVREFELPFSQLELENLVLRVTRTVGELRRDIRRLETPERQLVQAFGGRLFDAVFGGTIQGALQSSLNEAYRREAGLRIRLRLSDAPELADLPWEYLYSPSTNQFLSLSPDTPVVRYLDLPTAVRPLAVSPPLRVLVMISSPSDYPQLSVSEEWSRLNDALRDLVDRGLVTLTKLDRATLAALQRPLRRGEYHILHFIGHGGFDEQANDGALLLEDESGRGRLVSGQDLGVMLTGHRSLRLVILNACEGARSSRSDPFAGAAQSLLQQGIPAAIAMQFEISDQAAITFAHEFYGAVADGYPIDAALAESRRAIFAHGNEVEWATPVLYMRSPDGRVFRMRLPSAEAAQREAKEAAEREAEEREAREAAELVAKETAEREAKEAAELEAKEAAEREAEEREAKEAAERVAKEAAEREAKEAAEREAAEGKAKEAAERESKEAAEREAAVREGQGLPLSRAAQLLPAAAVLFGGLLLMVGSLRVDPDHSEVVHSLAQKPLLFMDNLAAFLVAPVLGFLLLLRRARHSLRIGGFLAGVGLEQIGSQLGIFLLMTDHQGGEPNFGWESFTAFIGAVMVLLTSISLFYRLREVEHSHAAPVFTRGSRALALLAGVVFFAAWFVQDDVNSTVPLVLTIPLAVGILIAASSTLSSNQSQAVRLFVGSGVLAFGTLVAVGYLFSFLSVDSYFGDISETSLGIRAVSGFLLIGAAVIADRAGRREPIQEVRTV